MRRHALVLAALALPLLTPAAAAAAGATDFITPPMAGIFGDIAKVVFGGLELTVKTFADIFTAMFGALADMLVPDSWAKKGTELLKWLVAVPNFNHRAFADLTTLSKLSAWMGLALLAVTLPVSLTLPSLNLTSASDTPATVIGRTLGAAVLILLWGTLWQQGAALGNQLSSAYLSSAIATRGMNAYMELIAVGGIVGPAIPFLGILIVLLASGVFLGALGLKVFLLIILGVVKVGGPLLLGLIPTQRGAQLARATFTAVSLCWGLPIVWGLIFVTSGVFIYRAKSIGAALGGGGFLADTGGTLIAGAAAIVGPLLCMAITRSALGPLGSQFSQVLSAASPAKLTQRLSAGAGAVAGRAGAIGGGAGAVKSASAPKGGPMAAMQRLQSSRIGAAQAVRMGASSVMSPSGAHPLASPGTAARVAAGGGLIGLAGTQAGRSAKKAQLAVAGAGGPRKAAGGVARELKSVTPNGSTAEAQRDPSRAARQNAAAVAALRPSGSRFESQPESARHRAPAGGPRPLPAGAAGPDRRPPQKTSPSQPAPRTTTQGPVGPVYGPSRTSGIAGVAGLPAKPEPRVPTRGAAPRQRATKPKAPRSPGPRARTPKPATQKPPTRRRKQED